MIELLERSKTYLRFSREEFLDIIISIGVISFIFYFGKKDEIGLLSALLIVTLSLIFHIALQKIAAIRVGFTGEFKIWWYGLLGSLALVFISRGALWWIILPGGMVFTLMAGLRLGKFRYGYNYMDMGTIGLVGPVASIILATIFKNIEIYVLGTPNVLFHNIFVFNLAFAICQMLPIPPLDGHYMFYASRNWYVFLFAVVVVYSLLAVWGNFYSWIIAIIFGIIAMVAYFVKFEL